MAIETESNTSNKSLERALQISCMRFYLGKRAAGLDDRGLINKFKILGTKSNLLGRVEQKDYTNLSKIPDFSILFGIVKKETLACLSSVNSGINDEKYTFFKRIKNDCCVVTPK